jgi:hypothetical protein
LGYIGNDAVLSLNVAAAPFTTALLDELAGERTRMNQHINKGLRESQM